MFANNLASQAQEALDALDQLLNEVENLEGHASGSSLTTEGRATQAIRSIKDSRIDIGDPRNNLTRLTPEMFETLDLPMSAIQEKQIADRHYDFYYMTINVSMMPFGGACFNELWFEVQFHPLESNDRPIVQSIFPVTKWHKVADLTAGLTLGVDSDALWKVSVASPAALESVRQALEEMGIPDADIEQRVVIDSSVSGLVTVHDFTFSTGRFDIAASGVGQNGAKWNLTNADLSSTTDNQFVIVFKTPAGQRELCLEMLANARVDFDWLGAQLRYVTSNLSERLRCWVKADDPACQDRANVFRLGVVYRRTHGVPGVQAPSPALTLPD